MDVGATTDEAQSLFALALSKGMDEAALRLWDEYDEVRPSALSAQWLVADIPGLESSTLLRLLAAGAPVVLLELNPQRQSALHVAAMRGDADLVRALLEAEGDAALRRDAVLWRDADGNRPRFYARRAGHAAVSEMLQNVVLDPDAVVDADYGLRRLHQSLWLGRVAEVERWIRAGAFRCWRMFSPSRPRWREPCG